MIRTCHGVLLLKRGCWTTASSRCPRKDRCYPFLPGIQSYYLVGATSYEFTAEQIVYSPGNSFSADPKKGLLACNCDKDDQVAKKGPHTATAKGKWSTKVKYTGVPYDE